MNITNALGGTMIEDSGNVIAYDAFADRKAIVPYDRAKALLAAFDAKWPRADYLDRIRYLIANA